MSSRARLIPLGPVAAAIFALVATVGVLIGIFGVDPVLAVRSAIGLP